MSKTELFVRKLSGLICITGAILVSTIGYGHPIIGFAFVLGGIWMILDEEEL